MHEGFAFFQEQARNTLVLTNVARSGEVSLVRKNTAVVLAVLLCVAMLAGCTQSKLQDEIKQKDEKIAQLQAEVNQLKEEIARLKAPSGSTQPLLTNLVTLYFIKSMPTEFYLHREDRLLHEATGTDLLRMLLEELIIGPRFPDLEPVLPSNVTVLSVQLKDGLATVDLSREARQLNVGARGEALAVSAIANTLTEVDGVTSVQILIEGEIVETLAGHVDISKPVRRDETVVIELK